MCNPQAMGQLGGGIGKGMTQATSPQLQRQAKELAKQQNPPPQQG